MAEFKIQLQYISKQHTGPENAFLFRKYLIDVLPKPAFFLTRHKVSQKM